MHIKKIKNRIKKSWLLLISFLIILLGITLIISTFSLPFINQNKEKKALNEFYESKNKEEKRTAEENKTEIQDKYEYIAVLKIPKISLEKGVVSKDSKYNSIEYGLEILRESDSPEVINGNVIIASHSGTSDISYFNELDKLEIGDISQIIYSGYIYNYKVDNIYNVQKNGKIVIKRNKNNSTLTLTTCNPKDNKKQLIIISSLIEKKKGQEDK